MLTEKAPRETRSLTGGDFWERRNAPPVIVENFSKAKFVPLSLNTPFKFHSCNRPPGFHVIL
jgi:hypothetical protein